VYCFFLFLLKLKRSTHSYSHKDVAIHVPPPCFMYIQMFSLISWLYWVFNWLPNRHKISTCLSTQRDTYMRMVAKYFESMLKQKIIRSLVVNWKIENKLKSLTFTNNTTATVFFGKSIQMFSDKVKKWSTKWCSQNTQWHCYGKLNIYSSMKKYTIC